ncbi:regulatory protein RecX [Actinokineospora iranica]|uniref:Regulatory protein RecX n=1 Tax=Actinokineospora iranica TaxID=1271860 RepID=A0A1G6LXJ8_9PSEU|nr:regulatory protein RecX [Actinokineospora iranica]SDC47436.1 regulatory protein [Actinokineospora iranica]
MSDRRYARRTRGSGDDADSSPGESSAARAVDPDDPAAKARDICYRLLAARDRTRLELEQALRRKEIPDDVAQSVLAKFDKAGLINDEAFAETWVRSRHTHRGLGRRALAMELRRKGVDDAIVAEAVSAVDSDAEADRAAQLVRGKLGGLRGVDDQVKIRRLVAMLARRGYPEGLAFRVVRTELAAAGADTATLDAFPD